jgi:hypothetical protein
MNISTADAMWYAYQGWSNGAARILIAYKTIFIDFLNQSWPAVLTALALGVIFIILIHTGVHKRLNIRSDNKPISLSIPTSLFGRIALLVVTTAAYILTIPLTIIIAAMLVVLPLVVTIEPFASIGSMDAAQYCEKPKASVPTIPHLAGFDENKGVIYQLWCDADTCAVLQGNTPYVVSKIAIPVTVSPAMSYSPPKDKIKEADKLCASKTAEKLGTSKQH